MVTPTNVFSRNSRVVETLLDFWFPIGSTIVQRPPYHANPGSIPVNFGIAFTTVPFVFGCLLYRRITTSKMKRFRALLTTDEYSWHTTSKTEIVVFFYLLLFFVVLVFSCFTILPLLVLASNNLVLGDFVGDVTFIFSMDAASHWRSHLMIFLLLLFSCFLCGCS